VINLSTLDFDYLYNTVRKNNKELLFYSQNTRGYLLENLSEGLKSDVHELKKRIKKNKQVEEISSKLLYDMLLIGVLMECKEQKNICGKMEYCDVHKNISNQIKQVVYHSKKFKYWMSVHNYLSLTAKILGLLYMTSFPFHRSVLLMKDIKKYKITDFYTLH